MTMYEEWCAERNKAEPVLPVPPLILAQECSSAVDARTVEPVPPAKRAPDDAKIDAEWDRFFSVAIPTPDGLGLYDPSESPEMPSGVAWDVLRRSEEASRIKLWGAKRG